MELETEVDAIHEERKKMQNVEPYVVVVKGEGSLEWKTVCDGKETEKRFKN